MAYDVTGGGNDDRPPVSLARGPITVLSADLRVAAMSIERIIRRLLVHEGRRQPGTPRQGRPPGCPPGTRRVYGTATGRLAPLTLGQGE